MRHINFFLVTIILINITLLSACSRISLSSVSAPNTTNKTALRIYNTLPIYANAAKLSWNPIQNNNTSVIRKRLIALHDMTQDESLREGIKQFQKDNGLQVDGVINEATLHALNIAPVIRYHELVNAMNEWVQYPEDADSRYIQVNIPSYEMHLIDHGEDVLHMPVIVGRESRPTPTLSSKITTIVFNPSWNVPETILAQDVIPGMQKNPNYMKEHYDMRVYESYKKDAPEINPATINWNQMTAKNFPYRVSSPPSAVNPLGRVKFIFYNEHDVYMHDTPDKGLFSDNVRARSSGCIRLQDPMALVNYFSVDNNELTPELITQYLSTFETKTIQLKNPMPVYITYIMAWVDRDGRAHFNDVYREQ